MVIIIHYKNLITETYGGKKAHSDYGSRAIKKRGGVKICGK